MKICGAYMKNVKRQYKESGGNNADGKGADAIVVFKNAAKRFMAKLVMWSLKEFGLGGRGGEGK